ncbi:MAG: hypothetical protein AAF841_06050 [Pseudomonadota bacterium]
MVPTLICIICFSSFGAYRAYRAKGKTLDVLHYAGAYAIFGLIVGTLLTIGLARAV